MTGLFAVWAVSLVVALVFQLATFDEVAGYVRGCFEAIGEYIALFFPDW